MRNEIEIKDLAKNFEDVKQLLAPSAGTAHYGDLDIRKDLHQIKARLESAPKKPPFSNSCPEKKTSN